jgi:hypothetical protein
MRTCHFVRQEMQKWLPPRGTSNPSTLTVARKKLACIHRSIQADIFALGPRFNGQRETQARPAKHTGTPPSWMIDLAQPTS